MTKKSQLLTHLFVIICLFIFNVNGSKKLRKKFVKEIEDGLCIYKNNTYDLRYSIPLEPSKKGKSFDCKLMKYLDDFGYLNESIYVDLNKQKISGVKIVTAITQDHRDEAGQMLMSFKKHFPGETIIVYDLGFNKKTVNEMKSLKFVEYRKFNASKYPKHLKKARSYGFKWIVVAEVLKEYPAVIWADASIRFQNRYFIEKVNKLVNCYQGKEENHKNKEQLIVEKLRKKFKIRNFTYKKNPNDEWLYKFNVQHCYKSNVLMHIPTFHGILSTTHQTFTKYFPVNKSKYNFPTERQQSTAFVTFFRTKDTVQNVMKWLVLCSLTHECTEPIHWFSCDGHLYPRNFFAKRHICHRFDQTLLTTILHNANNYDNRNYAVELYDNGIYAHDILKNYKTLMKN
uniref:DDE_Tnp_1 domain-containing protein n=1 Tax=Strongyloides venezuelensis TaxID=75913 RepID=A0A0K0F414_STRVS